MIFSILIFNINRCYIELSNTLAYILLLTYALNTVLEGNLEVISDFFCGSGHVVSKVCIQYTSQRMFCFYIPLLMI